MPHHSVEGEFADDERARQIDMDLFGGEEQADCHRQVVRGTFFAKIGGCEVDGDAFAPRVGERGILYRGADAFARFLNGGIGQTNNRHTRLTIRNVYFDINERTVEPDDRATRHFGEQRCDSAKRG